MNRLRKMLVAAPLLGLIAVSPLSRPVAAQEELVAAPVSGFEAYVGQLAARARVEGLSEEAIRTVTAGLTFNPRVVALDRNQPGAGPPTPTLNFAPYRRTHVDAARINRGRAVFREMAGTYPAIEARYGVPAPILFAIWGHETNYGSYTGDFDLARSLASLAYEGRRRELFADEFIALIRMADMGVPRSRMVGSWAGAFGNPQFLPSVWVRLAQDYDGDGLRNIWSSRADTLASIANYFRDAGWRSGQPWGVPVTVPADFAAPVETRLAATSCPRVHQRHSAWKTVREWRALGLQPQGAIGDDVLASLIEPDGRGAPAWLLTGNYRVILQYNCSNYYALSVGLLADEISR